MDPTGAPAGVASERPDGIRVLSFPRDDTNPYFDLFYGALRPYGVRVAYAGRLDETLLRPDRDFDLLHFHWSIELFWRWRRWGSTSEALGLIGWGQFLSRARRAGVRLAWTAHELRPPEGGRWFDQIGYALCARAAELCICHSEHLRSRLIRRFRLDSRKVLATPIGTYFGVFPPPHASALTRAAHGVPPGRRLLVCFGNLRPRKGIEVAMEAARRLGDDYGLIVAGAPASRASQAWFEEIARRVPDYPNLRFHGARLDHQALGDLLHAADAVLLPYREIYGSSALSACLAVGRAVVASDLPYFRETMRAEPLAGVLARPGDAQAMARAVDTFFAAGAERRHDAARRLGERLAWPNVIAPVGEWFRHHAEFVRG
jgi:glycosyltransferase involved in cell wall biosynthesis